MTSNFNVVRVDDTTYRQQAEIRLAEAQRLTAMGYHLIALHTVNQDLKCRCGERRCRSGKHPLPTIKVLRTPHEVEQYVRRRKTREMPHYGILSGVSSDQAWVPLILDLDLYKVDERGQRLNPIQELERRYGPIDYRRCHRSGSGGLHVFFRVRREVFSGFLNGQEHRIQIHQGALGVPGLDVLYSVGGRNGYTVGPGCIKPTKAVINGVEHLIPGFYWAEPGRELCAVSELPELPEALRQALVDSLERRFSTEIPANISATERTHAAIVAPTEGYHGWSAAQIQAALDHPPEVRWEWALKWLAQRSPISVNGADGRLAMYDAMRGLTRGFGFTVLEAWPLIQQWNETRTSDGNGRCCPWPESGEDGLFMAANWMSITGGRKHPPVGYLAVYYADAHARRPERQPRRKNHKTATVEREVYRRLLQGPVPKSAFDCYPERTLKRAVANLRKGGLVIHKKMFGHDCMWWLEPGSTLRAPSRSGRQRAFRRPRQ